MKDRIFDLLRVEDFDELKASNPRLFQRRLNSMEESLSWDTIKSIKNKNEWVKKKNNNELAETKIYNEIKFKNITITTNIFVAPFFACFGWKIPNFIQKIEDKYFNHRFKLLLFVVCKKK